ncbi:unnamed protein product [Trichobilharzia regenti]|nr:unnamed protein product [Trichobilharzia regenti]
MQWVFSNASAFEQCRNENWEDMKQKIGSEGCRVHGSLTVNRVAGAFHIAPGHSYTEDHAHVHSIQSLGLVQVSLSLYFIIVVSIIQVVLSQKMTNNFSPLQTDPCRFRGHRLMSPTLF